MNQSENLGRHDIITNIFGDTYLTTVNGDMCKEIAYSTYFDIELLPQLSEEFTFYIFIGSDSGMLYKHLQKLRLEPDSIYFLIEDSQITDLLREDIVNNNKNNLFIVGIDDWQERAKTVEIVKYIEVDRVKTIKSLAAKEQTYQPYISFAQKLHDDVNQLKWDHPDKFQKKIFIQRQIQNCADNYNPAIKLKNLLQGKPALILAGGPSLDNYIDWIEKHQQHYIVIAVTRVARRLLSTNIVPDIFVIADPFDYAFDTSKEVLAFGEKSILVSQSYAHPKIIGQWQGLHFYLGELLPWQSEYQPENIVGIGPTVTNCAMHLAIQLGIKNQILFGVDLCYSSDGFSHVSQTLEHDKGKDLGFTGIQVLTNNNQKMNTTYEWYEARNTISILAELIKKNNGKVINPNPDAAKIAHVSYQPLTAIKTPTEIINGYQLITKQLAKSENTDRLQHYSFVLEKNNQQLHYAELVLLDIKKIIDVLKHLDNKEHDKNKLSLMVKKEVEEIIHNLNKFSKIIAIIESVGINGFLDFIHPKQYKNNENQLNSAYLINVKKYYTCLYIASDRFIEELKSSIQRLKIRISEESNTNNVEEILKQWGDNGDQHYGRMNLLAKRNNDLYKKIKAEAQKEYKECFKRLHTPSRIKAPLPAPPPTISLKDTEKKLYGYFQKQDKDNLGQLIKQLSHLKNDESASLKHLAQGYLSELDGEMELAINEYLSANSDQTIESGLKRILDITLKNRDIENAIAALKALANISDEYLLQLANIYQVSEQYKDALDTFSLYIDNNPNDILVLIKMGILYLLLEIFDGAEFVFKHIIEIDPNNQSAQGYLKLINPKISYSTQPPNNIEIQNDYSIGISEYNFYKSLNPRTLNIKRLKNAENRGIIGFIATNSNINNIKFINTYKELTHKFINANFSIFYFEDKVKNKLKNLFKDKISKIQLIKLNSIYDLVENVEVYLFYDDNYHQHKYNQLNNQFLTKAAELIQRYSKNIYSLNYYNIKYTLASMSKHYDSIIMQDSINKKFHETLFTDDEIKQFYPYYTQLLFTKAINYHSEAIQKLELENDESYFLKSIELALKHRNFINFINEYSNNSKKFYLQNS